MLVDPLLGSAFFAGIWLFQAHLLSGVQNKLKPLGNKWSSDISFYPIGQLCGNPSSSIESPLNYKVIHRAGCTVFHLDTFGVSRQLNNRGSLHLRHISLSKMARLDLPRVVRFSFSLYSHMTHRLGSVSLLSRQPSESGFLSFQTSFKITAKTEKHVLIFSDMWISRGCRNLRSWGDSSPAF